MWSSCSISSSSSRGDSHRAKGPRYSGIYWEISDWPDSRALDSSTAISLRRSGDSRGAMVSRDSPAIRRTTTFSLTFRRLEKWVAMWRRLAWGLWLAWWRRYSTPTAFKTQGVAVFRLSRKTALTVSARSSRGKMRPTSTPRR